MRSFFSLALLFANNAFAQTYTSCNPLNTTCPDNPALGTTLTEVFNSSTTAFDPNYWTIDAGTDLISFGTNGAELPLVTNKDTVTLVSTFYIFFGTLEFIMKAAPGQGIISTVILLSDDLDEIDWEVKGANTTTVSSNYYGWGNQSQSFAEYPTLDNPQEGYHNYTVDWTQERIDYIIDGQIVRTVPYAPPGLYPQTPCRVQFGVWCGGCSARPGTVEWAGGVPNWGEAPFTAYVKSLRVVDGHTNASTYTYSDHSGSYQSINVTEGLSKAYKAINHLSTAEEVSKSWAGLSSGAKIGVAAGVLGLAAVLAVAFAFYCVRERKAGRAEAAMYEAQWEKQEEELMEYRRMMASGGEAVYRQSILAEGKVGKDGYGRL